MQRNISNRTVSSTAKPFSRKFFNEAYYFLDDGSSPTPAPSLASSASSNVAAVDWDASDDANKAVAAHLYIQRVAAMHAEGDEGYRREFEVLEAEGRKNEEGENSREGKKKEKRKREGEDYVKEEQKPNHLQRWT